MAFVRVHDALLQRKSWICLGRSGMTRSAYGISRKYLLDGVMVARRAIYTLARAIGGSVIDRILKPTSHVPTLVSSGIVNGPSSHLTFE